MTNEFYNPYILAAVVSWIICQLIKYFTRAYQGDRDIHYLYRSGGFPSAHAAIVTSLVVGFGFPTNKALAPFAFTVILAAIVIYDSLHVRRSVGQYGEAIQQLQQASKIPKKDQVPILISYGHNLPEVLGGMLVGAVTGALFMIRFWERGARHILQPSSNYAQSVLMIIWGVIALIALGALLWLRLGSIHKLPSSRKIRRVIRGGLLAPALVGLLLVGAENLNIVFFDRLILQYVVAIWMFASLTIGYYTVLTDIAAHLKTEREHFIKKTTSRKKPASKKPTKKSK